MVGNGRRVFSPACGDDDGIAAGVGEDIDCRTDTCTLKVFGDHSEGFEDIVDVPVTFAK